MYRLAYYALCVLFISAALASSGCAKKVSGPPEDDSAILRNVISQVPDNSRNATTFKAFFAKDGTVPSENDRKRFEKLQFKGIDNATIAGETATQKVEVRDDDSGKTLGQVDWTFVRENSQWKLKTAPLP